jgi:SAM-dependent methyltransferase
VTEPATDGRLTDEAYWDEYWQHHAAALPVETKRRHDTLQVNAILDVLDAHLTPAPEKNALEIGGAPGQYLAYVHRRFGYRCSILDFSAYGCAVTRRNFELLGIPVEVFERDARDAELDIGRFDTVFSLGLIEHFDELGPIVAAHARLVRPGGTLVLGVPNMRGVNEFFMKRLCPERLAAHNTSAMRPESWTAFEVDLGLERRFRGFVGGFEPGVFAVLERPGGHRTALYKIARLLVRTVGRHFPALRRLDHPKLSGYLMGVWRVPEAGNAASPTPRQLPGRQC